jgi:hypothetical protein
MKEIIAAVIVLLPDLPSTTGDWLRNNLRQSKCTCVSDEKLSVVLRRTIARRQCGHEAVICVRAVGMSHEQMDRCYGMITQVYV